MIPVDEMVAGPEGHEMGVVGGCRDGHGPGAADVRVTQLVREHLQLVGRQVVVVPQHVVVRRARRTLKCHQKISICKTSQQMYSGNRDASPG